MWLLCEDDGKTLFNTNKVYDFYVYKGCVYATAKENTYLFCKCGSDEEAKEELLELRAMLNKKCS